ncbi:MAG: sigma-54 dependent transcriptional regulator [Acidobacteriota bacterium]
MGRKILVIDDNLDIRRTLRMTLEEEGYQIADAASGPEGIQKALTDEPDAILLDIKMPNMDGMEVLQDLRRRDPRVPIIMISGHADVDTALEAIEKGANTLLEKPLNPETVLLRLREQFERLRDREDLAERRREDEAHYRMIGDSPPMRRLREGIERAAPTNVTVLITGESGTGKELVARAIHASSQRAGQPFIKVNCAAIPEELIESELFGHEKGSFTGATAKQIGKFVQADGGTIFLDEVGDMSPRTQAKVLRVLQEGEVEPVGAARVFRVDVRVLAATNKDLAAEIREGRFREDLLFRLNVIPVECPPLRERTGDIPALVQHFANLFCRENNFKPKSFSREAMDALIRHPWPGNIRELQNVVERMLIMSDGDEVREIALAAPSAKPEGGGYDRIATLKEFKEVSERDFLEQKLRRFHWNISQTAKEIDTPRSNLYKKLEQYGLTKGRPTGDDPSGHGE